jgi:phage shock protein PspC (stress-responsive transcriptional regulator)
MSATDANPAATPKHEIFGVCRRLGEDFGFHPNILRVAMAIGLIWSIEGVAFAYLAMAVIVVASRLLSPEPKRTAADSITPAPVAEWNDAPAPVFQKAA